MSNFLNNIGSVAASLSSDQIVAFLVFILALALSQTIAQKALSTLLSILGVLAALYFIAPDLYAQAIQLIVTICSKVSALLAKA